MKRSNAIGIVGSGRMAQALGRLLREHGEPVACVASRSAHHAAEAAEFIGGGVEVVSLPDMPRRVSRMLIAVPDRALASVIEALASSGVGGGIALHTSGARDIEDFGPLLDAGVSCGTFHPLQTISDPVQGCAALRGIAFAVSGGEQAIAWARSIAELLQGRAVAISPERRPLYHAAAVMAGNYSVALLDAASEVMSLASDAQRDEAMTLLAPLARTALENALQRGTAPALTGPIERGDTNTVSLHLAALRSAPPRVRKLYAAAGLQTLELASRKGLPQDTIQELHALLESSAV